MINTSIIRAKGIHIGDKIQPQDQSITLRSLRIMNAIVSNPQNPILPDADELLLDILFVLI